MKVFNKKQKPTEQPQRPAQSRPQIMIRSQIKAGIYIGIGFSGGWGVPTSKGSAGDPKNLKVF